jgi:hypothetical protein
MTNREKLVTLAIFAVILGLIGGVVMYRAARRKAAREHFWTTGIPGTAEVLELGEGRGATNDNPQVNLTLEVTTEGAGRFRATTTIYVRTLAIPRVQPGCTLDVRVDPTDPKRVIIDPAIEYAP